MKILTQSQVHAAIKLKHRELKVYLALVSYYNDKYGYAFPTVEQIREVTGVDKANIYSTLNELEKKGFIRREKSERKSYNRNNIYYILDKVENPNSLLEKPAEKPVFTEEVYNDISLESKQEKSPKTQIDLTSFEEEEEGKKLSWEDKDFLSDIFKDYRRDQEEVKTIKICDRYYYQRMKGSELKSEIARLTKIVENEEEGYEGEEINLRIAREVYEEEYGW